MTPKKMATPEDIEGSDKIKAKEPKKKLEEPEKDEAQEKKATDEKVVDTEALKAELQEATEKAKEVEGLTATVETMKQEVEAQKTAIAEYEKLVGELVEAKMKQVPEQFKELIPDNLDIKQQLNWLGKAEAKGLFTKEAKKKPDVEIGKPMNVDVPQVDTSKLTGSQLLKMAYNTIKK